MSERHYWTYIVECSDGSFYTGVTNDPHRRAREHNTLHEPSSYTHGRTPVTLRWCEAFGDVHDAIAAEKRIKGWSRAKKQALIARDFQALRRLSRGNPPSTSSE